MDTTKSAQKIADLQRRTGVEHLHALGPRALHGFLADIERRIGGGADIDRLLEEYGLITPQMLQAVGGDRFAPRVRGVP